MKVGSVSRAETVVAQNNTAKTMESGSLDVFATPALVALMEKAAVNGIELPDEQTSVGISMNVKHLSATPVGMRVRAEAELIEIAGRKLTFKVQAFDEIGLIGEGVHERFIVNGEDFVKKANNKLNKLQEK